MIVNDFTGDNGKWARGLTVSKVRYPTWSGLRWGNMSQRCKQNGARQLARPSYVGCAMSENFKDFQYFVEWARQQVGYAAIGVALDKDLLIKGNKVYGEYTCCFLPEPINNFLMLKRTNRGSHPPGVDFHKASQKFRAREGLHNYIGLFDSPEEAFYAFKVCKEVRAKQLAETYKKQLASAAYTALMNYTVDIND